MRRLMVVLGVFLLFLAACASEPDGAVPEHVAPVRPGESAAPTSAGPVTSFTVLATGDVLIHPALTDQAVEDGDGERDFVPLFQGVRYAVESADLAICHLEVPLATKQGPFQGYPLFHGPPEVATALARTGYDTCTTASNHTFDHGPEGVRTTLDALDEAGLRYTGSARTELEAAAPLITNVGGVKVGQVSFTFGFNLGTESPAPWMGNELSVEGVLAAARATRKAGAEVVVASLHWGNEDQHEPTAEQQRIADALLADPAVDLIVGHHAHVVQPFAKLHGKWVAYGLGNQVARHAEPRETTEEGVMARFTFAKGPDGWAVTKAEYLPTLVDLGPPIRLLDLTRADVELAGDRKAEALTRTDRVVNSLGAAEDGLTRPGR